MAAATIIPEIRSPENEDWHADISPARVPSFGRNVCEVHSRVEAKGRGNVGGAAKLGRDEIGSGFRQVIVQRAALNSTNNSSLPDARIGHRVQQIREKV